MQKSVMVSEFIKFYNLKKAEKHSHHFKKLVTLVLKKTNKQKWP